MIKLILKKFLFGICLIVLCQTSSADNALDGSILCQDRWPEVLKKIYSQALKFRCPDNNLFKESDFLFRKRKIDGVIEGLMEFYQGGYMEDERLAEIFEAEIKKFGTDKVEFLEELYNRRQDALLKLEVKKVSGHLISVGFAGAMMELNIFCVYEFDDGVFDYACSKLTVGLNDLGRVYGMLDEFKANGNVSMLKLSKGYKVYPCEKVTCEHVIK